MGEAGEGPGPAGLVPLERPLWLGRELVFSAPSILLSFLTNPALLSLSTSGPSRPAAGGCIYMQKLTNKHDQEITPKKFSSSIFFNISANQILLINPNSK